MKYRVTFETAIVVTKYTIAPIACWPLPPDASTSNVFWRKLYWWVAITHLLVSTLPWLYNIYLNSDDADLLIKVLSELCAITSTITKMIICKSEATHLQSLLAEIDSFLQRATSEEMEVIQFYVDRCLLSHTFVLISTFFGLIVFIAGPVMLAQPLPGDTAYPFSLQPLWIWAMLYISQIIITIQVGSMAMLDFMFAILLWYTGARFELLSMELERATNADEVTCCIRKHQQLLEYVEILKVPLRIMAFEVSIVVTFAITTGGFVLIRHPPWYLAAKYIFFDLVSALELFLFTWPADNLVEMVIASLLHLSVSSRIGDAAFSSAWIGKSPMVLKDLIIIMQRSQSPSIIAVEGLLPTLSLQFYGSAMSTSFSYLTTLRAMAEN